MTFINWSDPDEMVGLLLEYVADERGSSPDGARERFLAALLAELQDLADMLGEATQADAIEKLRAIQRSQPAEFEGDEVLSHVTDCIEELERIRKDGGE